MSDIVQARRLLADAWRLRKEANERDVETALLRKRAEDLSQKALELMYRETPIRRSRATRVRIDDEIRDEVRRLAKDRRLSIHEIANMVGLPNSGRVSEILNGRR